jgi:hypothetical protein
MKNKIIYIFMIMVMMSCSSSNFKKSRKSNKQVFSFSDLSGEYKLERVENKKNKLIIVKRKLLRAGNLNKPVEKSISISSKSDSRKKIFNQDFEPLFSQFSVWFNKKRYFSQIKLIKKINSYEVSIQSPERKNIEKKFFKITSKNSTHCFFFQLIKCINQENVLDKLLNKVGNNKNIKIIWDGYPFQNDQLEHISSELISDAKIEYEGLSNKSHRITLTVLNQKVFFKLNKNLEFKEMNWVIQGISQKKVSL